MPKGPKGEKRPADVVGASDDEGSPFANLRLVLASRWRKSSHQRLLKSALGQIRKMRACPLRVRFAPLSG